MLRNRINQFAEALRLVGIDSSTDLQSMHLGEIEEEALNVLELLTSLHVYARQQNEDAVETTLVDLTVALGHLSHHTNTVLPPLKRDLDIAELDEDTEVEQSALIPA
ncbi:MAG: hypothetical protein KDE19_25290 [Caldilineaceae bacterium]|nr:hypothetical protein [Caldilineaceae bacterium]